MKRTIKRGFLAAAFLLIPFVAAAQDAASSADYVSRAEYDKLKAEHEAMKKEMDALKTAVQQMANGTVPTAPAEGPASEGKQVVAATASQSEIAELHQEVDTLKTEVHETLPGTTNFLLAGYGTAGFTARSGEDPFFTATFNPIFLWKLSDRLLFEGELELELEGGETSVALELAQISYVLNDYMTIGAGKFLNPTDYFVERQHMGWVNKTPDKPLAVYDGLMPETELGAQLRGVIPIGPTKLEYAAFVANAPDLIMTPDDTLGMLDFENFDNHGGHIAVGGHVGFIPIPELEVGYGIQRSKVGPRDHAVEAILQSVDFNYVRDSNLLKGLIALRAQWVWSHVDHFVYDADGSEGFGPFSFNNNRNGGYAQLAYRPTKINNNIIKNFEPIVRYDRLNQLHTPVSFDEERWTIGLDYWITPSVVVKAAYEFDNKNGGASDQDAFMLQFAAGF
jgi:cell division protein FtsB